MVFINPWIWHIVNDEEMPNIDYSCLDDKEYITIQSILLSIMTVALIFFIVIGVVFNLLLGLSIAIIALGLIVIVGWLDIIKTIRGEHKNNKL